MRSGPRSERHDTEPTALPTKIHDRQRQRTGAVAARPLEPWMQRIRASSHLSEDPNVRVRGASRLRALTRRATSSRRWPHIVAERRPPCERDRARCQTAPASAQWSWSHAGVGRVVATISTALTACTPALIGTEIPFDGAAIGCRMTRARRSPSRRRPLGPTKTRGRSDPDSPAALRQPRSLAAAIRLDYAQSGRGRLNRSLGRTARMPGSYPRKPSRL